MDYSKFSDSDLQALKSGDITQLSDEGLALLKGQTSSVPEGYGVPSESSGSKFQAENPNLSAAISAGGETLKSIGKAASSAPSSMLDYLIGSVEGLKTIPEIASDPGKYGPLIYNALKEQYGNLAQDGGLKKQFENDPANLFSLISLPLTLAGGSLSLGGKLTNLSRVSSAGKTLLRAGDMLEPANATFAIPKVISNTPVVGGTIRGVKSGVDHIIDYALGEGTTGVGKESIRIAREEATPAFKKAMRGDTSAKDIIDMAQSKLGELADTRRGEYAQRYQIFKNSPNPVDISPAKQTLSDSFSSFDIKIDPTNNKLSFGETNITNGADMIAIKNAYKSIENWQDMSPAKVETLKQRLEGFEAQAGTDKGRKIIGDVRRQLQTDIENSLPDAMAKNNYRLMNERYGDLKNLQGQISDTFSMAPGKQQDTAIKKLTSTMRVQFKGRKELLDVLASEGIDIKELTQSIAGYSMNDFNSKALFGKGAQLAGGIKFVTDLFAGTANPAIIGTLLTSSPRVVGEFLAATGVKGRDIGAFLTQRPKLKKAFDLYSNNKSFFDRSRNVMYQINKTQEVQQ